MITLNKITVRSLPTLSAKIMGANEDIGFNILVITNTVSLTYVVTYVSTDTTSFAVVLRNMVNLTATLTGTDINLTT